jgi:HTH-type transcriptional regulator, competence development regulator
LLRHVAPIIDVDTPLLSKIERGERIIRKDVIPNLAMFLKVDKNDLMTLWLADQMHNVLEGEPMADQALKTVSKNIKNSK